MSKRNSAFNKILNVDTIMDRFSRFETPSIDRDISSFTKFISQREPSLNVGMEALPIDNRTTLQNQPDNALSFLAQTGQLEVSDMNKNTKLEKEENVVNDNKIVEPISKFQGVATPYTPYDLYNKPEGYFNNFIGNGKTNYIKEYTCHFNSINRNIVKYPNPFNFLITFTPISSEPNAYITKKFENILYIKLKVAILPKKYYVKKTILTDAPPTEITDLFGLAFPPADNAIINVGATPTYAIIHAYYKVDLILFEVSININPVSTISFINSSSNNFTTGDAVQFSASVYPHNIISGTTYFINISGSTFSLHSTYSQAIAGTNKITLTTTGIDVKVSYVNKVINYTNYEPEISTVITTSNEVTKILAPTPSYIYYNFVLDNLSVLNEKYLIVKINEITDTSEFSTDQSLASSFTILFPDTVYDNAIFSDGSYSEKIFKYSDLGTLSKMLLSITNAVNKPISTNTIAYDNEISNINSTLCTCSTNAITGNKERDYKCICSYIRHPRYEKNQLDLMFKFGIIETDMNKRVFS